MNDLNMVNAQNAELRSINSPTGLECDALSSVPDKTLIDEFRRAMGDSDGRQLGLADSANFDASGMVDSFAEGDSVMPFATLFSMGAGSSSTPVSEAGSVAPPLSPEALEALVDRILVSSAELGRSEVRLALKDSVLGGTEIVLSRSTEGQLIVSLHCTSEPSFQTLVASQMDLKARLEDFENRSVQVSVDFDREDSDADRRSRGYFEQEQQDA